METPMDQPLLDEFFQRSAASWQAATAAWQRAMQDAAAALGTPGAGFPAPDPAHLESWQRAWEGAAAANPMVKLMLDSGAALGAQMQAAFGSPGAAAPGLEALSQALSANLEASLQAASAASAALAHRLQAADPASLRRVWEELGREYARDLATLPEKLAPARTGELVRIAGELARGQPGPEARAWLERFQESLRVKLQRGPEHYVEAEAVPVGPTPRRVVLDEGPLTLWRYGPEDAPAGRPPLLVVYSIINRAWILDLVPGSSVVEHLLARGLDVYLVEWKAPTPGCTDTLERYLDLLGRATDAVRATSGAERVHVFGWCIGGTLALLHAALRPDHVASLVTLTTPVTGTDGGVLAVLSDPAVFPLDEIVAGAGLVPGRMVRTAIMAVKPYLEVLKWKAFYENLHDDRVMALFRPVDRWANDNPDLPADVFRRFIEDVYRKDRLVAEGIRLGDRTVSLREVTAPLLNLVAEEDWIVPPAAAARVTEAVGSAEKTTERLPGPHVGFVMDPRARASWDRIAAFVHAHAPQVTP